MRRLRRPAAAHRHDDRVEAAAGRQPGDAPGDRGLAGPLAGPDHRERRDRKGRSLLGRVEPEVGAHVRDARDQRDGRELHPFPVAEHRFVRQVQDDVGRQVGDGAPQATHPVVGDEAHGHAEVGEFGAGRQLLGPADEQRRDDLVPTLACRHQGGTRDRGVVLTVHEGERSHVGLLGGWGSGLADQSPPGTGLAAEPETFAGSWTRFSSSRCICVPVAIATFAICWRSPKGNLRKIVTSPPSISSTL